MSVTFPLTKIQPPRPRSDSVVRPRVEAAFAQALVARRLVLVCAPAGFGKTTLLGRHAALLEPSRAIAWISADEDDDLGRFAGCLVAALDPFDLPWRTSPDALIAALDGGRTARAEFVAGLVNALLCAQADSGTIFIDDAHRIEDPSIFELLDALIERLPTHWSIVVGSRLEPPLSLARLRARGEIAELREDTLRFTEAEIQRLLDSHSSAPPESAAHADEHAVRAAPRSDARTAPSCSAVELLERTGGWPAGLAMMIGHAMSASAIGAGAPRRQLFDYLASEVLAAMPAPLREFLLRCSVLDELTPERCAFVSGSAQATQWLVEVERHAPFVSVIDERQPVLRLHDLFRNCLDDLLRREMPDEVPELLKRAAGCEHDPVRRVGYWLRAGAWAQAEAALVEFGSAMVASGQIVPVLRLIEQFEPAWRDASPRLAHLRGLCAWAHWDLHITCASLEQAAAGFQARGEHDAAQRSRVLMVIGLTAGGQVARAAQTLAELRSQPMDAHTETTAWQATSWHLLAASRFDEVSSALARTVELLERSQDAMLWFQSAPVSEMIGLPGTRPLLERYAAGAVARSLAEPPTQLRVLADLMHAQLHLWAGRLDVAAEILVTAESDCRWLNRPPTLIGRLDLFAAICHALRGERDAALAAADTRLADLTADARTSGRAQVWLNHMLYFKLRIASALGDANTQRETAARIDANRNPAEQAMFVRERACLPARLAELDQRWDEAAARYGESLRDETGLNLYGQADEVRLRLAHALVRQRKLAEAAAVLSPVFQSVGASGEVAGVLFAGAPVLGTLAQTAWAGFLGSAQWHSLRHWASIAGLDVAASEPAASPMPTLSNTAGSIAADGLVDSLSAREREVLRCIAAGDSNKLIARAFDISPNTVKRHVSNILDKLGLNSRGQAAAWYRAHH